MIGGTFGKQFQGGGKAGKQVRYAVFSYLNNWDLNENIKGNLSRDKNSVNLKNQEGSTVYFIL